MFINKKNYRNPWAWVSTLYYAQGIPYVIVVNLSVIMYKNLALSNKDFDISNTDITFYTSWLYLPWVIKPLWGPLVDLFRTKRFWIVTMQLAVGAGLAGVALTLPMANYFQYTLAFFWLMAFSSATHDIAADGFYMLGLTKHDQAFYVGIRSTFYRIATITGQGLLVILAGYLEKRGSVASAWSIVFLVLTGLFIISVIYHFLILPYPPEDVVKRETSAKHVVKEFFKTFSLFFKKKQIGIIIAFLLIYRFGEAQLAKMSLPFFRDPRHEGGLGLTTEEIGIFYGTIGIIGLSLGGIVGGFLASRDGLKRWIWWMFAAINIPHILYVYLAYFQPENVYLISACVAMEQFGYGFGFTAYMLYMMHVADGEYKTAHYALCTGFMALSMMIPGMFSGWIEDMVGYKIFFVWILLAMIPGFFIMKLIPLEADYGKNDK